MVEDYAARNSGGHIFIMNKLLHELRKLLWQHKKDIAHYDLPRITEEMEDASNIPAIIQDELAIEVDPGDLNCVHKLNADQSFAFTAIMIVVEQKQSALFFVDGPVGTGKTYLYRALLATLRTFGHIAIATATSGIGATLLPKNVVFPHLSDYVNDATYMVGRTILTPKNEDVDMLNDLIIKKTSTKEKVYYSWGSVEGDSNKSLPGRVFKLNYSEWHATP